MVDRLVCLCWCVGDAVDYWLMRAQLRIMEAVYGARGGRFAREKARLPGGRL
jgi:hypothetical protein